MLNLFLFILGILLIVCGVLVYDKNNNSYVGILSGILIIVLLVLNNKNRIKEKFVGKECIIQRGNEVINNKNMLSCHVTKRENSGNVIVKLKNKNDKIKIDNYFSQSSVILPYEDNGNVVDKVGFDYNYYTPLVLICSNEDGSEFYNCDDKLEYK